MLANYDALGRVIQVQAQDGSVTRTTYSGNQTTVADPAGIQRRMVYDALGRLTMVFEDPSGLNYSTSYAYDALDDLISVSQGTSCPNNCEWRSFSYDSLKRLTTAANPESGTTTYTYDGAGNLITKTDARGNTVNYTYDALNRLTQKSYPNNAADVVWTATVKYTYDQGGAHSVGHLTQVEAVGKSVSEYGPFDALGRVTASGQSTANTHYSFAYTYNLAGALTSETYPSGRVISTNYDSANRIAQVTGTLNGQTKAYASGLTYAPHGALSAFSYGNGVNRANTFNGRMQPQESTDRVTGQLNWALDLQYFWGDDATQTTNNNGNLRGELIKTWNGANFSTPSNYWEAFSYDGVNRLRSMTDNGGGVNNERDFAYDQFGNMWVSNNTGFNASGTMPVANIYNGANRLKSVNYDAAGNQLHANDNTISYDAENRIAQLAEPTSLGGSQMTYYYDGEDHRVEKLVNGAVSTVYVYDAQGQLAAEYAANATPAALCQTCYLSNDHLGSTRMVTDEAGHVIARHDYLPFGEEIVSAAGRTSVWGASDAINQKFTGKEHDSESGLDYFGARYLGSALGRFTSPDPLLSSGRPWDPQSWNRYAYALNNPLRYVDPTGLYEWDTTLGAGCTDETLNGGTCDGFTKGQGNNIVDERKAIRDQLKRLNKSKDASLRAVGNAIGQEDKDNGVTISMGPVTPGAAAQVSNTVPLSLDKNGNPMLDLRISPGANGDPLFVGLAHEGSHVWDAQSVAHGDRPFVLHGETELSGYLETVTAAKYLGWSSVGPQGGNPFWSSSWSATDQQTRPPQEIMRFLLTSPLYASKNGTVAYTLGK